MGAVDTATLLVVEGLLVGGLVGLRVLCAHLVDLTAVPRALHPRLALGSRLTPWFAALAVGMVLTGLVLMAL